MKGQIVILYIIICTICCQQRLLSDIEKNIFVQFGKLKQSKMNKPNLISFNPDDVHFYLYPDKRNPERRVEIVYGNKQSLKNAKLVSNNPIYIFTHGFLLNVSIGGCDQLKNGFLKRNYDNIMCVDWGKLAGPDVNIISATNPLGFAFYFIAQKTTVIAGERMAEFLYFLKANKVIQNFEKIHLIGHSLGSHMMGTTGAKVQRDTGLKVGRITGLDPAGPFYKKVPAKYKLDKSKALFVDVIHSNTELFGTPESLGHADFFANGGRGIDQPACQNFTKSFISATVFMCGHSRTFGYYERAILGENLFGCKCKHNSKTFLKISCPKPKTCAIHVPFTVNLSSTTRGNYYMKISQKPPLNIRPDYLPYTLDGVVE